MEGSRHQATAGTVSSRSSGDAVILEGEFSLAGIPALLEDSQGWFTAGKDVSIDLSGIRRSDSGGVLLLLEWQRRAKSAGCKLSYRNPPEQMRSLIRFYQVEDFLPI